MQEAFTSSPSEMRLILNPFDRYHAQDLLSSCKEIFKSMEDYNICLS